MIVFVRKLRSRCLALGLRVFLLKVFVDDTMVLMKFPGRGAVVRDGQLEIDVSLADKEVADAEDVLSARLLSSVANSLEDENDIQMTFDAPSMNASGRMPVLDLEVWVESDLIYFSFYEKPMTSRQVIHNLSALPWNMKKVTLAGEVARRYFNTSPCLVQTSVMSDIVDKFRHKLMVSGYSIRERELIVKEGRNRYENVVQQVSEGLRPLYRPSTWEKEARALEKKVKGRSWWGKRHKSVMFVQSSPNEILRKEIQKIVDRSGFKVKVVQRGGRTLKSMLQRSDVKPQ